MNIAELSDSWGCVGALCMLPAACAMSGLHLVKSLYSF